MEIARTVPELEAETKWKAIGDRALAVWRFDLARESFEKAGDLSALMLLLLAVGDRDGLTKLAAQAGASTQARRVTVMNFLSCSDAASRVTGAAHKIPALPCHIYILSLARTHI